MAHKLHLQTGRDNRWSKRMRGQTEIPLGGLDWRGEVGGDSLTNADSLSTSPRSSFYAEAAAASAAAASQATMVLADAMLLELQVGFVWVCGLCVWFIVWCGLCGFSLCTTREVFTQYYLCGIL